MVGAFLTLPLPLVVTTLTLVVLWRLPAFGHRVLRFLRDLRDYRADR